jgi:ABC-type multidrug transport system ATPase subunit
MELELDGLRRKYGSVTALDDLSFAVPAGQVFGFLGRTVRVRPPRCARSSA